MQADPRRFEAGTLWRRVHQQTEHALGKGALASIPTDFQFVEQSGVRFLVRVVSKLARKAAQKRHSDPLDLPGGRDFNPFLPYDEDLFVADVSASHVGLLNKYNVVDHHLLIVTRAFEDQLALLTLEDFEALWLCLTEGPALGFYNAGEIAGASQRHKHLQLVPLPLAPQGPAIPIAPLLRELPADGKVKESFELPFVHALTKAPPPEQPLETAAQTLLEGYHALLRSVALIAPAGPPPESAARPYNLLVTPHWMLLVPRGRECLEKISVNALGFAGALLVRNADEMRLLRARGPMTLLAHVGLSRA